LICCIPLDTSIPSFAISACSSVILPSSTSLSILCSWKAINESFIRSLLNFKKFDKIASTINITTGASQSTVLGFDLTRFSKTSAGAVNTPVNLSMKGIGLTSSTKLGS